MPEHLKIAVCICEGVTYADFMLPMDLISNVNYADHPVFSKIFGEIPYRVTIDYLAPSLDIVHGLNPALLGLKPTGTYADAISKKAKYDIIWVPAGPMPDMVAMKDTTPEDEIEFIRQAAPNAKYVMSVCGGAAILAMAGVLEGKRATTNKSMFKMIVGMYGNGRSITWVPKARWVVDGNVWTSSGVTAGTDMALALLKELVGPEVTTKIRVMAEIAEDKGSEEDPFAAIHGLV